MFFSINQPPRLTCHPSRVGKMSTSSNGWAVNGHITWSASPTSVVSQHKLMSGWGLWKQRSVPPYGPIWLSKELYVTYF